METKNYYEILGISVSASQEEITSAKNALAKRYHPDVNIKDGIDTTLQMQEILEAYRILSNPQKRALYDQKLYRGRPKQMQTFDLYEAETTEENSGQPTFVTYWKASGELYEIIEQSNQMSKSRTPSGQLTALAMQALVQILTLRESGIPERYWYPDIMNWLLFQWYRNRNYTIPHLLALYDTYERQEMSAIEKFKLQNRIYRFQHAIRKLMKY